MIKALALRPGDRVAAVSLSWGGPSVFPHRYQAGKRQLEQAFGVQVVESRHALTDAEWLAAHPEARAADLMEAFSDRTVQGIVSTIGGDDSIRLLRLERVPGDRDSLVDGSIQAFCGRYGESLRVFWLPRFRHSYLAAYLLTAQLRT